MLISALYYWMCTYFCWMIFFFSLLLCRVYQPSWNICTQVTRITYVRFLIVLAGMLRFLAALAGMLRFLAALAGMLRFLAALAGIQTLDKCIYRVVSMDSFPGLIKVFWEWGCLLNWVLISFPTYHDQSNWWFSSEHKGLLQMALCGWVLLHMLHYQTSFHVAGLVPRPLLPPVFQCIQFQYTIQIVYK